jgi:hypothetical protein
MVIDCRHKMTIRLMKLGLAGTAAALICLLGGVANAKPADTSPPSIAHDPPASAATGKLLEIKARITDPSGVLYPRLYYRKAGTTSFQNTTMQRVGDRWVGAIPGFAVQGATLEYYLEAFDKQGNGPARHGSAAAPHRIELQVVKAAPISQPRSRPATQPVSQPASQPATQPAVSKGAVTATPWYKRWWVWAIVGAVAVGGGVTAGVLASGGDGGSSGVSIDVVAHDPAGVTP